MQVTRSYYNASDDLLRTDTITMRRKGNTLVSKAQFHTFQRVLNSQLFYGPASRAISYIEVSGDFDIIEASSGDFLECEWYSPSAFCNMSDLPQTGEDA